MAERILNLFATYTFTDLYWSLNEKERHEVRRRIAIEAEGLAEATNFYSVFPARADTDVLIWSAWGADELDTTSRAFSRYGAEAESWRRYIKPVQTLWGLTRPSMYARGKSEQDMDPFDDNRCKYLVVYPFAKTKEWYLMSMDARQGQMNEHIKLGKTYPEIKQLLVYSFGLQDQEFVVSYEMEDLEKFSKLVNELRCTEARRHTLYDTPLITGIRQTKEEFIR